MKMLESKNALITGGAAGIGKSIAFALAAEGANIILADINYEAARAMAEDLKAKDVKSTAFKFDISEVTGAKPFVEEVESKFGKIDILVNNAGVTSSTKLFEITPEQWDFIMNINCRGTFFLSQAVLERMLERKSGRIINIGSISGERGARFAGAHYSVSKAAVIMMTKVFARVAADSGVTVNTVSPGLIKTDMAMTLDMKVDPSDIPMNRMGTPDEVAQAVLFLTSDMAVYITGQNISVNGGQSMR